MRARVFFSLVAAAVAATALATTSGAGAVKVANVGPLDLSTRAAVIHYLRTIHVDPTGLVIQRGLRNYAGPSCPGAGWTCTGTAHAVVQVASAAGRNTFSCSSRTCAVVQVAKAAAADNTAKCIKITSLAQTCTINQSSTTSNNVAVVYQAAVGALAPTQTATQTASITQQATGAANTNTACVSQNVVVDGSTAAKSSPINVALEAHQTLTVRQDSSNGGNAAQSSATLRGDCDTGHPLTQRQILNSIAVGRGAVTQSENAANGGANMAIDVEQNQSAGFLGSAHGPNSANFNQASSLIAIADTSAGPVVQTQSSAGGGLLGTINQDSRDRSTATATQSETQCEDAHTTASVRCDHATQDSPAYSLTQTQFGPVKKGLGTATQTGNPADTFTINQSSTQDDDTGSGQTNLVQGDCSTSGTCTVSQNTNVDGQTHTNTQSGQEVDTSTTCSGSECTSGAGPSLTLLPNGLSVSNTDVGEFGYGGMRGAGTGSITVNGISGPVFRAFLYWHGPTNSTDPNSNATVTFNGNSVSGTNIGTASDNNWGFVNSQAYRADVTALVPGDGTYSLSNFIKTGENTVADINGAALIVFYDDGNTSDDRNVVLWNGNDSTLASGNDPAGWDETISGVPYPSSGSASLDLVVSDGQSYADGELDVNGEAVADAGPVFQGDTGPNYAGNPEGVTGSLWDIKSFDITSLLSDGANDLHITSATNQDALSLVVAIANVPASSQPEIQVVSPAASPSVGAGVTPPTAANPAPPGSGANP